jgi:outer membrane protein
MPWLSRAKNRTSIAAALLLLPAFALAALPIPRDTVPLEAPKGTILGQVEPPLHRRPSPPLPDNVIEPPAIPQQYSVMNNGFEPELTPADLPAKRGAAITGPITLSMRDAILLALRYNPNILASQLSRISDKYSLLLAQRQFVPVYTLNGGATFTSATRPIYNANASVSVETPIGTQVTLGYANVFPVAGNASNFGAVNLQVVQPLLQGFGFVNKINLLNAYDTEEIAKLNFKNSVITSVVAVINAYLALISDYDNLDIQSSNLRNTKITTDQYRLQEKAGKMAPSDVTQQLAQLAQAQLSYEQARNQVQLDYLSFLNSLGLTDNANIKIDRKIDFKNYRIPGEKEAVAIGLDNNIGYQSALLTLRQAERNVVTTQNERLPTLNVTANETFHPANLGRTGGIIPQGIIDTTTTSSVGINLIVPIDNVTGKANYIDAKIAVEQAKLALAQTKQTLVSTILNDLSQLKSLREQIRISKQSVLFQKKAYENYQLKLKYGKATVFDVTQNQTLYINQALQLVSLEISFLNQVTTFQSNLGTTLDAWNIKLRY